MIENQDWRCQYQEYLGRGLLEPRLGALAAQQDSIKCVKYERFSKVPIKHSTDREWYNIEVVVGFQVSPLKSGVSPRHCQLKLDLPLQVGLHDAGNVDDV